MSVKVISTCETHEVGEGDRDSAYTLQQYGTLFNNRNSVYGVIDTTYPLREFTQFN